MPQDHKIAILRLSALGDCINTLALIGALKQQDPSVEIHLFIDQRFSSIFYNDEGQCPCIIHALDFKNDGIIKLLTKLRSSIKDLHFTALLNLQTSIKASLVSLCIKAKRKIGYNKERSREGHSCFINERIGTVEKEHVIDGYLAFAEQLLGYKVEPCFDFLLTKSEQDYASSLFEGEDKIFMLAPTSAKASKNYHAQGYAQVCDYMLSKGYALAIIGDNKSASMAQEIISYMSIKDGLIYNLCGKTKLRQLVAVVARADLMLSVDSAPLHLASALHIPVVGLFAIHNPKRVGAYNYPQYAVSVYEQEAQAELGHAPKHWRYRVKNNEAMHTIDSKDIIAMLQRVIEEQKHEA